MSGLATLPLPLGIPDANVARRFPITSQKLPARCSCAVLSGASVASEGGNLLVMGLCERI